MIAQLSDARFDSLIQLLISAVTIVPAIAAAFWAKSAQRSSTEAKENSAGALHEVKSNGGMSDPDPTLKDYIKFVGEIVEKDGRRLDKLEELLDQHLKHSKIMDAALAEVFFVVKPDLKPESFLDAM